LFLLLSLYQSPLIPSFHDEPKIKEMLRFANACGAITTTKKGVIPDKHK
jgi:sugar/nucleoside kinase (ribokinase family)